MFCSSLVRMQISLNITHYAFVFLMLNISHSTDGQHLLEIY